MKATYLAGPVILIGIGMLFLLNNFGFHLPLSRIIGEFWPLILIFFGSMQILRGLTVGGGTRQYGFLTGGVMMVTVGGLFLLQNLFDISFGRTWPVLLIAAGTLGFLRFTGPASMNGRGGWGR